MKKVLFNILGIIAGYITGSLGYLLCYFIFYGLIGNIPFIRSILSYPASFEEYALIGTVMGYAYTSIVPCNFICKFGKAKYNYGSLILAIICVIRMIATTITYAATNGFSFIIIFIIIQTIVVFGIITIPAFENEDITH